MRYRYVQKCTRWRKWRTFAKILAKIQMRWRFESGCFDENGDFDKNGELSPKFDECSYDVAKGPF